MKSALAPLVLGLVFAIGCAGETADAPNANKGTNTPADGDAKSGKPDANNIPTTVDPPQAAGNGSQRQGGGGGPQMATMVFAQRDSNKDGKLTSDEASEDMIKSMDQNGDGVVTRDELPTGQGHPTGEKDGGAHVPADQDPQ